jgi:hypothetical protein
MRVRVRERSERPTLNVLDHLGVHDDRVNVSLLDLFIVTVFKEVVDVSLSGGHHEVRGERRQGLRRD